MARIRGLRDLRVYQDARRLRRAIFHASSGFPPEERFRLTSQIRDSSRSVGANLAEAWRRRRYPAAFVAKLTDAAAEAEETRAHLETAVECGYLRAAEARPLHISYDRLLAQLTRMQAHPEKWKPRVETRNIPLPPGGGSERGRSDKNQGGHRGLPPSPSGRGGRESGQGDPSDEPPPSLRRDGGP